MPRQLWKSAARKRRFELEGKTVGVIGLGAIGRGDRENLPGGMKIAGYDPFLSREQIEALGVRRMRT